MNCRQDRKYRGWCRGTRAVVAVVSVVLVTLFVGCSGFADEVQKERSAPAQAGDGVEAAKGLYDSMVVVFREDTAGVDRATEETLTVISDYEPVGDERRRRFVGRIVPLQGGIGVQITAEYQVESDDSDDGWDDQPREEVEAEAGPVELALARSVERRYHAGE